MQIKINNKTYELNFGIRFINLMNQKHNVNQNGLYQGMGVNQAVTSLYQYDPIGLAEVIQAASWINKDKPTQLEIENYLDTTADIKKLCDEMLKELEKSNSTKAQVKNALKAMKKAQEKAINQSLEKSV